MFATSAVALALAAAVAYAQDLSVQPPSLAQCANSAINFSGGSGPYYVAILQGQDPCDHDAIQEFFDVNENSVSYTPVLPSNSQVVIYVSDSNGVEAWSNTITIGDGDSSCLGTPTPDQEAPYNTPTDNTPTEDTSTYNPPTEDTNNPPADDTPIDEQTTDNTTTDDADTSYQSPSEDNASDDASSSSSSAAPTGTAYNGPYNPATPSSTASIDTKDSSATVQSTNNSDKDNTPANVNDKTGGATGLAVSAVTALCAVLVVSLGLF